jgi:abortive infection bacteriophage resistance protein
MARVAYDKPWLPISEQIRKLESRGLIIDNEKEAAEFLWHLNYYRFSGYCLAFEQSRHCFQSGTTFSQVRSAYDFDVKLRDLLTEALEVIEVDSRSVIAHIFGEKCGAFGYVDSRHFRPSFDHQEWLSRLTDEAERSSELFVTHFRSQYDGFPRLPFWIATEVMSFGAVSKMYSGLLDQYQTPVSARYNIQKQDFGSVLHHLTYVRNVCAHHCRLWDRIWDIKPKIPVGKHWNPPTVPDHSRVFVTLLFIYRILKKCSANLKFATEWRRRVNELMKAPPETEHALARMGMPKTWYDHPYWT